MIAYVVTFSITIIIGLSNAIDCPNVGGQGFTPENRAVALNRHNELRSDLANGKVIAANNQLLRSGKNIYQLEWDCDLEKMAQDWANRCVYGHSGDDHRQGAGENIYMWSKWESVDTHMLRAIQMWWDEVKQYYPDSNPDNIMDWGLLGTYGHWTQMSWGETTKLGCGIANCSQSGDNMSFVVCNYLVTGNYMDKKIFEWGDGCSSDSDCTTFKDSKCNTQNKLCLTKGQSPSTGSEGPEPEKPEPQVTIEPETPEPEKPEPSGPEQPINQMCVDDVEFCENIVSAEICHLAAAYKHCRESCGLCDKPPKQVTTDPSCQDEYDQCEEAFYVCGEQKDTFALKCKKTCELC